MKTIIEQAERILGGARVISESLDEKKYSKIKDFIDLMFDASGSPLSHRDKYVRAFSDSYSSSELDKINTEMKKISNDNDFDKFAFGGMSDWKRVESKYNLPSGLISKAREKIY